MTLLFGHARLSSSDYQLVRDMDAALLYEAANQYIAMVNEQTMDALNLFVPSTPTTKYSERYQLGLTGRMQKASELSTGAPVARSGGWNVAYPLDNYHESLLLSDIDAAYMTPEELQQHVDGILARSMNAKRHAALYRIFNNTTDTFTDNRWGDLTIQPLAIGATDGVLYPPVEGTDSEATEDHYLGSAYLKTAISDTNNPYKTIADDLVHHGMNETNDIPVAFLINSAQQTVTEALTSFVPYVPPAIDRGMDTDQVLMPARNIPGKVIGYVTGYGWVSVWNWIPDGWIVGINMAAPPPLKMRADPPETGLGNGGLVLLPEERHGVMTFNSWRLRFGIGASNRLGACVMDLSNADSDYDIPTAYA